MGFLLLAINIGLFSLWFLLSKEKLDYYPSSKLGKYSFIQSNSSLSDFLKKMKEKRKILYLGSSESTLDWNLSAQINHLDTNNNHIESLSMAWFSPIHSCLLITRMVRNEMDLPPMILVINPVYFTRSHDVINESGVSQILRSTTFFKMDHFDIKDKMGKELQELYKRHYSYSWLARPIELQKYITNLMFLYSYKDYSAPVSYQFDENNYRYMGFIPEYDISRNIWVNRTDPKIIQLNQWRIENENLSPNLKGLKCINNITADSNVPLLILILPVNFRYYEYIGIDIENYIKNYSRIKRQIFNTFNKGGSYIIDLSEEPNLDFGFSDRMHIDEYGAYQLANYVVADSMYKSFINESKFFYNNP